MNDRADRPDGIVQPTSVEELRQAVRHHPRVLALGGGTKWKGRGIDGRPVPISISALRGIIEYQPDEYTITAWAGTPLAEINSELDRHGQGLPFDPPFASNGATLGGTVACGLSGSGSQRHGRLRDFILAIQFVTGDGVVARAGAKVVKNSAGFDLPKLMAGSLGRFGILTEITFKVFPKAAAVRRLAVPTRSLEDAIELIIRLNHSPLVLDALDLGPDGALQIALAGQPDALDGRCRRLRAFVDRETGPAPDRSLTSRLGNDLFAQPSARIIKTALSPALIPTVDGALRAAGGTAFYTFGGATGWISWPAAVDSLNALLAKHHLTGLILGGAQPPSLIGKFPGANLAGRIRHALDPQTRFPEFQN